MTRLDIVMESNNFSADEKLHVSVCYAAAVQCRRGHTMVWGPQLTLKCMISSYLMIYCFLLRFGSPKFSSCPLHQIAEPIVPLRVQHVSHRRPSSRFNTNYLLTNTLCGPALKCQSYSYARKADASLRPICWCGARASYLHDHCGGREKKSLKKIKKLKPVLEEAQRLADEGHLHFHRSATFQGVFRRPQQHVCHLLHHQPHVWHVLKLKRQNRDVFLRPGGKWVHCFRILWQLSWEKFKERKRAHLVVKSFCHWCAQISQIWLDVPINDLLVVNVNLQKVIKWNKIF